MVVLELDPDLGRAYCRLGIGEDLSVCRGSIPERGLTAPMPKAIATMAPYLYILNFLHSCLVVEFSTNANVGNSVEGGGSERSRGPRSSGSGKLFLLRGPHKQQLRAKRLIFCIKKREKRR